MPWTKKKIDAQLVKHIAEKHDLTLMQATVLVRRGVVEDADIKFILERDISYLHNPFLFADMEKAVERILAAADEQETVMIFGDRDMDGIAGTAIIARSLRELGLEPRWQVPLAESGYGFTVDDVARAAEEGVTLIITIDCGISSVKETSYAASLGIDVLIFDHHNVGAAVPDAFALVNPKVEAQHYPFKDMCAAFIALKLRMALAYARSGAFNQDTCLLAIVPLTNAFRFEMMCVRNMVPAWKKEFVVAEGNSDIMLEKIAGALEGLPIVVYDAAQQQQLMRRAVGQSVDLECRDIREEAEALIPSLKNKSLLHISAKSKFSRYAAAASTPDAKEIGHETPREIDALFRVYEAVSLRTTSAYAASCEDASDLAALATVADIMPLVNENRILMHAGLRRLAESPTVGVGMLMREAGVLKNAESPKTIDTTVIGWRITPLINASGRMGRADVGVQLLLEDDAEKARGYAQEIIKLNERRKRQMDDVKKELEAQADESAARGKSFVFVYSEKLSHAFTGMLAGQFARKYGIPCFMLANRDERVISGSIRCEKSFQATRFLTRLREYFIDFGGHQAAAGFSIDRGQLADFTRDAEAAFLEYANEHGESLEAGGDGTPVDLEIPEDKFNPDEMKALVKLFEPYGEAWDPISIGFANLAVEACDFVGKNAEHARLTVRIGSYKVPALLWSYAQLLPGATPHDLTALTRVSFIAHPKVNEYMGVSQINLIIKEMDGAWNA